MHSSAKLLTPKPSYQSRKVKLKKTKTKRNDWQLRELLFNCSRPTLAGDYDFRNAPAGIDCRIYNSPVRIQINNFITPKSHVPNDVDL